MKRSILFAFFILVISSNAALAITDKPSAVLRPGAMAGEGGNGADLFLDIILPFAGNQNRLFFLNPNLRLGSSDENEENIGIGYRALLNERLIFGLNAYYDTMRSGENNRYNQWGAGVEILSKWLDVRANYYKPFGDTKNRVPGLDEYSFGSSALLSVRGFEEALEGYDAEIGFLIPAVSDFMETRVYVGGYRYDSL